MNKCPRCGREPMNHFCEMGMCELKVVTKGFDIDQTRMILFHKVDTALSEAILKHGVQGDISIAQQYMIVAEEFGEIAKDLNDGNYENSKTEIVQTIAMLVKLYWLVNKS